MPCRHEMQMTQAEGLAQIPMEDCCWNVVVRVSAAWHVGVRLVLSQDRVLRTRMLPTV